MPDGNFHPRTETNWLSKTDKSQISDVFDYLAPVGLSPLSMEKAIDTNLVIIRTSEPWGGITGVCLPLEYNHHQSDLCFGDYSSCYELLWLLDATENPIEWVQCFILPRQVEMLRKLHNARLFYCGKDAAVGGQFLSHGWTQGEANFELILERESKGLFFDCTSQFYFAP